MKFLLEKEYIESRKNFTAKLYEANDKIKVQTLFQAKQQIEEEQGKYNALETDNERINFIQACIDQLKNAENLRYARSSIIDAIKDSNWNKDIVDYINKISELGVDIYDPVIDLVTTLIDNNKIDYASSKTWLLNPSLYNRPTEDIGYSIKALTLASNQSLQQGEDGENKFFDNDNPLVVKDLMDKGKIKGAAAIRDILNSKQTKEYDNRKSKKADVKNRVSPKEWLQQTLIDLKKVPVNELINKYYKDGDNPEETLQRMYDNGFKL